MRVVREFAEFLFFNSKSADFDTDSAFLTRENSVSILYRFRLLAVPHSRCTVLLNIMSVLIGSRLSLVLSLSIRSLTKTGYSLSKARVFFTFADPFRRS
jgi:hypothetical protein